MTSDLKENDEDAGVSTHMPLARHDYSADALTVDEYVSTHMPLARHDVTLYAGIGLVKCFYSHASCEA